MKMTCLELYNDHLSDLLNKEAEPRVLSEVILEEYRVFGIRSVCTI